MSCALVETTDLPCLLVAVEVVVTVYCAACQYNVPKYLSVNRLSIPSKKKRLASPNLKIICPVLSPNQDHQQKWRTIIILQAGNFKSSYRLRCSDSRYKTKAVCLVELPGLARTALFPVSTWFDVQIKRGRPGNFLYITDPVQIHQHIGFSCFESEFPLDVQRSTVDRFCNYYRVIVSKNLLDGKHPMVHGTMATKIALPELFVSEAT